MRIVLCHGCFDILHLGHVRHLKAAAKLGDYLVVSVTSDAHVNKGPGRPKFSQAERMEVLRSLRCVDQVFAADGPTEAILKWHPSFYVKGSEYRDNLPEQKLVESMGGKVVFTDEIVYSSTALVPCLS